MTFASKTGFQRAKSDSITQRYLAQGALGAQSRVPLGERPRPVDGVEVVRVLEEREQVVEEQLHLNHERHAHQKPDV